MADFVAFLLPQVTGQFISAPLERIKAIQQRLGSGSYSEDDYLGTLEAPLRHGQTPGALTIAKEIYTRQGFKALFNGLSVGLVKDFVSKLLNAILSELLSFPPLEGTILGLLLGGIPAVLNAALTHPLHVIHTTRAGDLNKDK
eukprot:385416_1